METPEPPAAPEAPAPRNVGQETRDTLQAQVDLAPAVYASEAQYRPEYAQLDNQIMRDNLLGKGTDPGLLNLFETQIAPRASALDATTATKQRTADIADVEALGPRAAAAFKAANPDQAALLAKLNEQALGTGASDIENELNKQAMSDLQLGGNISADENRNVQQYTRGIFQKKGLTNSNPAIFAEALNRSEFSRNRLNERRGFAQSVDQYSNERKGADRSFLGNVTQLNSSATLDPFMTILGRPSTANQTGQAQFQNAGFSVNSGPQLFNPMNPYAQDVYDSNYNGAAAAGIAGANNKAAAFGAQQTQRGQMIGGGIAAGAAIGGAIILAA
jgi:hypothetical protein